jgi:amidohydrolase
MGANKNIDALHEQMIGWRRDIHMHPETAFEEVRTAKLVAEKLKAWGYQVTEGIAKTGVVGTLKVGNSGRTIALRADMDALNVVETNDFGHASTIKGKMHACGHDGHTTMLLGAAQVLAETKNFDGTVHVIFQPAEEGLGGGRAMVQDGLFQRFPAETVWGMHNMPGYPSGHFAVRKGPMMAGSDRVDITVRGVGGHAAFPHKTVDPVVTAAAIVTALQSIASRTIDPLDQVVVSVTQIHAGDAYNVIPEEVVMCGSVRTFKPQVQAQVIEAIERIATNVAAAHGAMAEVKYTKGYPPTVNSDKETEIATEVARAVVGPEKVKTDITPMMGSEDFSFMLLEKPGCYIFLGNGAGDERGACMCHNPGYDFNDEILPIGARYWQALVESQLPKR